MKHRFGLFPQYFDQTSRGEKTIEVRLNDKKRKLVKVGDDIVFEKLPARKEFLTVKVDGIRTFASIEDMLDEYGPSKLGNLCKDSLARIYSMDDIKEVGLICFEFSFKRKLFQKF